MTVLLKINTCSLTLYLLSFQTKSKKSSSSSSSKPPAKNSAAKKTGKMSSSLNIEPPTATASLSSPPLKSVASKSTAVLPQETSELETLKVSEKIRPAKVTKAAKSNTKSSPPNISSLEDEHEEPPLKRKEVLKTVNIKKEIVNTGREEDDLIGSGNEVFLAEDDEDINNNRGTRLSAEGGGPFSTNEIKKNYEPPFNPKTEQRKALRGNKNDPNSGPFSTTETVIIMIIKSMDSENIISRHELKLPINSKEKIFTIGREEDENDIGLPFDEEISGR